MNISMSYKSYYESFSVKKFENLGIWIDEIIELSSYDFKCSFAFSYLITFILKYAQNIRTTIDLNNGDNNFR